jgi:hypothetical protein
MAPSRTVTVWSKTSAALAVAALAGCTSYTYNCNVKDACRTSDASAPGVHVVTGAPPAPSPPAPGPR